MGGILLWGGFVVMVGVVGLFCVVFCFDFWVLVFDFGWSVLVLLWVFVVGWGVEMVFCWCLGVCFLD